MQKIMIISLNIIFFGTKSSTKEEKEIKSIKNDLVLGKLHIWYRNLVGASGPKVLIETGLQRLTSF